MPLIPTGALITAAAHAATGIGAFNVIHVETAEALAAAAESVGLPVILQISENCAEYHGDLAPLAAASLAIARAASVSIAVHLDHATDERLAMRAVDLGFGSVMYDGAHLDYDENVAATARIVDYAHARGVFVEAELGTISGKAGAHAPHVRTDPDEAAAFVRATGVDTLAVAVGSSHAMLERTASLDVALIERLRAAVGIPLVLHGSSGVADAQLVGAIRAGMTKINVSTHFNGVFTAAVRDYLRENPTVVDSRKYVAAGRDPVTREAARLITLFAVNSETRVAL